MEISCSKGAHEEYSTFDLVTSFENQNFEQTRMNMLREWLIALKIQPSME